jgi:protein-S-isoprenylcysteine O-methyltransferase Ste14
MVMQLTLLGCGWICWCVLHSLLIAPPVTSFFRRLPAGIRPYQRLGYNIIAGVTLLPLVLWTRHLPGSSVLIWQGGWLALRFFLLALACVLFYCGARHYDMGYFLGLRQIAGGSSPLLLTKDSSFARKGIFAIVRHPWYLASFLLLWSALPAYTVPTSLAAAILSLYLIVGTLLEERKLVAEFGEGYRAYQREVPMFIPWRRIVALWPKRT